METKGASLPDLSTALPSPHPTHTAYARCNSAATSEDGGDSEMADIKVLSPG